MIAHLMTSTGKYGSSRPNGLLEKGDEQESLGVLGYEKEQPRHDISPREPEHCWLEVKLKSESFAALLGAIQTGRSPDSLYVRVRGLQYGWEPDGAGVIWDVEAKPRAPVTELSFGFPLTALGLDASPVPKRVDGAYHLPASRADIQALQHDLAQHIESLKLSAWKAFIGFVVLALLILLFRR